MRKIAALALSVAVTMPALADVNAGVKMHRLAGVKMHHG